MPPQKTRTRNNRTIHHLMRMDSGKIARLHLSRKGNPKTSPERRAVKEDALGQLDSEGFVSGQARAIFSDRGIGARRKKKPKLES